MGRVMGTVTHDLPLQMPSVGTSRIGDATAMISKGLY